MGVVVGELIFLHVQPPASGPLRLLLRQEESASRQRQNHDQAPVRASQMMRKLHVRARDHVHDLVRLQSTETRVA